MKMSCLTSACLGLLTVLVSTEGLSASTVESDLDAIVSNTIRSHSSLPNAGIAVGVIKDGQVVFAKGYGLRDSALNLPVTPQTRFAIGSNTKSFTALGLAMLKDRDGRQFDFDARVNTYLPDFRLIDPAVSEKLTTADMCSHRSGLPRHDMMRVHFSRSEIIRRMQFLEMDYRPEYGYHRYLNYNNLMFAAAGAVTEAISGVSWEDYTRREILAPLGMNSTSFALDGRTGNPEASLSYNQDGSLSHVSDLSNIGPAGSMNSSAIDMLKYLSFYLSAGVDASGTRLISPENLTALFAGRTVLAPNTNIFGSSNICFTGTASCFNYYGLGWAIQYDGANYLAYNGGEIDGFYSFMSLLGSKNLGVVVLNNVDRNPAVQILGRAINQYFLDGRVPVTTALGDAPVSAGPIRIHPGTNPLFQIAAPPRSAAPFIPVAAYTHRAYGDVQFLTDGTNYVMKYFDDMYWQVNPTAAPDWVTYSLILSASPPVVSTLSTDMYLYRAGTAGGPVLAVYPFFDPHALSGFTLAPIPLPAR
jgi:CubicO group peptidase (beta-lactamase class C family)